MYIKLRTFLLLLILVVFSHANTLKSQGSFLRNIEVMMESKQISNTSIDSINKQVDSFLLHNGTSNNTIDLLYKIEKICTSRNYLTGIADAKFNIARNYSIRFKTAYALKYYLQSVSLAEELNDTIRQAKADLQIGIVYYQQKNFVTAQNYFKTSAKLFKDTKQKAKQSLSFYLIGVVNIDLNHFDSAEYYFQKGIIIRYQLNDQKGLIESYVELAKMFIKQRQPDSALSMMNKSLSFANSLKKENTFISIKHNIDAEAYLQKGQNALAYKAALECLKYAKLDGVPSLLSEAYLIVYRSAAASKNYSDAFYYQSKYLTLRDSFYSAERSDALTRTESNFRIEKKQSEINSLEEKNQLRSILNYSFIIGILLLLSMSMLLFNRYRLKQKANIEITEQKNVIEKKSNEITQSINYAKRIQRAILPPISYVHQHLKNSFILYKPKDIVAGDFYWMEHVVSSSMSHVSSSEQPPETINQQPETILFAACDCTGHGVPGAMVSVVCNNALNRTVREFGLSSPAEILDKTAELVVDYFSKSEEQIYDGMDISLCSINKNTKELIWAGANNPLWIIRNSEVIEIAANKQPIGKSDKILPFTNYNFQLQSSDSVYLITDGFADQFGGEGKQKKLTRKRFKKLLCSLQSLSMPLQGIELEKFMTNFKKETEQVDDILVIGFKV